METLKIAFFGFKPLIQRQIWLHKEVSYCEMEKAAVQAVHPTIRAFEQMQNCQRILGRLYLFDATREEQEAAKEAVRQAPVALPIGAATKELEKARDAALTPHKAAVSERKERGRLDSM
jgi:hypothetical protein